MLTGGSLDSLLHDPMPKPPDPWQTVQRILARKREFGITRLGSVTGLDRAGIDVVQVVRPASRSVAVNQGKGLTHALAAISGLMESLEGWASERIPTHRVTVGTAAERDENNIWSHLLPGEGFVEAMSWIAGWDLISSSPVHVPLALVDTAYLIPSPHPRWLPRDTTGLAAGTSLQQAMTHACFEILERHARCHALRMPHFFDRFQLDARSVRTGCAGDILRRLHSADFEVGIWALPSEHRLPAYWCHVMESAGKPPLAALPAEGFSCAQTHDEALTKALLEACQSRLGVISAAREDIPAGAYVYEDMRELSSWRRQLAISGLPYPSPEVPIANANTLKIAVNALQVAGANAVVAVVLHSDESIPLHVVRMIAPPLETNPEIDFGR